MIFGSMLNIVHSSNIGFVADTADISAIVMAAVDMPL